MADIVWKFAADWRWYKDPEVAKTFTIAMNHIHRARHWLNDKIKLERDHREVVNRLEEEISPGILAARVALEQAQNEYDIAEAEAKAMRTGGGSKKKLPQDVSARLKELRLKKSAAKDAISPMREKIKEDASFQIRKEKLQEILKEKRAELPSRSLVNWGTRQLLKKTFDQICQSADMRFRRWDGKQGGRGSVAVHFQSKETVCRICNQPANADCKRNHDIYQRDIPFTFADAMAGKNMYFRLQMLPGYTRCAALPPQPGSKRSQRLSFAIAWIQMGKCDGGKWKEEWIKIPVRISRELPPETRIKWVVLTVRRVGTQLQWSVQFTVDSDNSDSRTKTHGTVAVDIGWRVVPEGIRVAVWRGEDERERIFLKEGSSCEDSFGQDLILPTKLVQRWMLADDIQSRRDKMRDLFRDTLASWLAGKKLSNNLFASLIEFETHLRECGLNLEEKGNPLAAARYRERADAVHALTDPAIWTGKKPKASKEFKAIAEQVRLQFISKWQSTFKLARFVISWRSCPFEGSDVLQDGMESWRWYDYHLCEYQAGLKQKAIQIRNYLFKNWAAALRRNYGTLILKDIDWRKVAELPEVEDCPPELARPIRHRRMIGAPGILASILQEKFYRTNKLGGPTLKAQYVCASCGHQHAHEPPMVRRYHTCESCGLTWDQDVNAALVMLQHASSEVAT